MQQTREMLVVILHFVVGLIGIVLLYLALFLRETEQGELQNLLEKLWVNIDDLSKTALRRQTAFLQQISALVNSGLNRLFGLRLFSLGAISASLCFSMGAASLFLAWFVASINSNQATVCLIVGVLSIIVGLSATPFRYIGLCWIPGSIAYMLWVQHGWMAIAYGISELVFLLGGGVLSDVFFIAVSRWTIRRASELKSGWKTVILLALNGCIGLTLFAIPLFLPDLFPKIIDWLTNGEFNINIDINLAILCLGASNVVPGIIALVVVLVALAALVHLALWPILERPIYSLQRFGVARNPKLLAATSITCLLFAWPHSIVIQSLARLVRS